MAVPIEFPKDINNKITSLLDIDTRRTLNIYTKLKIPQELSEKITKCFIVQKKQDTFKPYIRIIYYKMHGNRDELIKILENNAKNTHLLTIQERCLSLIIRDLFIVSKDRFVHINIGIDKSYSYMTTTTDFHQSMITFYQKI